MEGEYVYRSKYNTGPMEGEYVYQSKCKALQMLAEKITQALLPFQCCSRDSRPVWLRQAEKQQDDTSAQLS